MNNHQLVEKFYKQEETSGRCNSLFFEYNTLYSYGSHYPLAKIITIKGVKYSLINITGYSNTTSKHIGIARYYSPYPIIEVKTPLDYINKAEMLEKLKSAVDKAKNKEKRARLENMREYHRQNITTLEGYITLLKQWKGA